jgi:hypothetical protein
LPLLMTSSPLPPARIEASAETLRGFVVPTYTVPCTLAPAASVTVICVDPAATPQIM